MSESLVRRVCPFNSCVRAAAAFDSCDRIVLRLRMMTFTVEYQQEDDGRWLAEVLEMPGVLAYGQSSDEAIAKAQALALRVLADRLEHGENAREFVNISFAAA